MMAKRLEHFEEGVFSALHKKALALRAQGREVFDLSVGTPDMAPPEAVMRAVAEAAMRPESYRYTLCDVPEMLEAVAAYYVRRYGVTVDAACEIVGVHGTQEGMGHLGMALCDPGDVVLLPDPGYPVFEAGAWFGEAEEHFYPLIAENGFLPRLADIPEEILRRTRYMVVSYPSNPTGAAAPRSLFEELIAYARKYGFYIINDNAYSDIIFTEEPGFSFLSVPGAKEVGAEFFSLSKSFNVTGARISFLVGNPEIVGALSLLRSQMDFGMFYPVQMAAVAALQTPRAFVEAQCEEYRRRRDALCDGLSAIGWDVKRSDGTMFVFAPLPKGYADSAAFCDLLLERAGVVCTPGIAFGQRGEGYVRFALTRPVADLQQVVARIAESGIL